MTVMYSFCVWFPVRLGAIIVSVSRIVESLACIIATAVGLVNERNTSREIFELIDTYELIVARGFFQSVAHDTSDWLYGFIGIFALHIFTCLLLLLGCFKCWVVLIYPFLILDFLRLVVLSSTLVILLLIIKSNSITLGMVIGTSIFGGFFMLYLWYQWFCVVSLCQIIREVDRMEKDTPKDHGQGYTEATGMANFESFYNKARNQPSTNFVMPMLQ